MKTKRKEKKTIKKWKKRYENGTSSTTVAGQCDLISEDLFICLFERLKMLEVLGDENYVHDASARLTLAHRYSPHDNVAYAFSVPVAIWISSGNVRIRNCEGQRERYCDADLNSICWRNRVRRGDKQISWSATTRVSSDGSRPSRWMTVETSTLRVTTHGEDSKRWRSGRPFSDRETAAWANRRRKNFVKRTICMPHWTRHCSDRDRSELKWNCSIEAIWANVHRTEDQKLICWSNNPTANLGEREKRMKIPSVSMKLLDRFSGLSNAGDEDSMF